jgi:hypothetical protein
MKRNTLKTFLPWPFLAVSLLFQEVALLIPESKKLEKKA